jgi:hypothetical protein
VFLRWFDIAAYRREIRWMNQERESSSILAVNSSKDRERSKISFYQL